MKAEIKSISLAGLEINSFWPNAIDDFSVGGDAVIGITGQEGGDIFSFTVCSPKWFAKQNSEKAVFVRHFIFMNEYDDFALKGLIQELVRNTSGNSWDEIALQLSRYLFWEFEDYEEF
jgi:hypothetical protein